MTQSYAHSVGRREQACLVPTGNAVKMAGGIKLMLRERKKNRLAEYDYSNSGAYFVTLCVQNRESVFGAIMDGEMKLNEYRQIAGDCWKKLPQHYSDCRLDEFVIMPNHLHGIVLFADSVGNRHACSLQQNRQYQQLPIIIGSYKSAISKIIHQTGYLEFQWQKAYHDRIIRNNPVQWDADRENPAIKIAGTRPAWSLQDNGKIEMNKEMS